MDTSTSGGVNAHRAAVADLDLVAQAVAAVRAADENLTATLRVVLARRSTTGLTGEEIAKAAQMRRSGMYKRIGTAT